MDSVLRRAETIRRTSLIDNNVFITKLALFPLADLQEIERRLKFILASIVVELLLMQIELNLR